MNVTTHLPTSPPIPPLLPSPPRSSCSTVLQDMDEHTLRQFLLEVGTGGGGGGWRGAGEGVQRLKHVMK